MPAGTIDDPGDIAHHRAIAIAKIIFDRETSRLAATAMTVRGSRLDGLTASFDAALRAGSG